MPFVDVFMPIDNIILYLVIAAIFEALAVYLLQFRRVPGALLLVLCQLCKGLWIFAKAFCSMGSDLPTKLLWARFTEWMPLLLIYFWFEFILVVSQQSSKAFKTLQFFVRAITVALVLIIAFDNWLGWYWGPVSLEGPVLKIEFGPAAYVTMIFCYSMNLISLGLSINWIYYSKGLRRQQAMVLSVTPLFNFIGNVLGYALEIQAVPPQVPGLLLSALYVTWVFYRWRIYSILPLAQEAVMRSINDGLMVLDKKGYIVDLNPAAKEVFAGLSVAIDDKFTAVADVWPALAQITQAEAFEVTRDKRIYYIRTLPLTAPHGQLLGKTIRFKDITGQKLDEAKLIEQEKALSILTERARLGRELHDGQGQLWSYINMQVEAVRSLLEKKDVEKASMLLENLAGVIQGIHSDLRESITGLQLAATRDGVWRTIEEYLQWFGENYGVETELKMAGECLDVLLPLATEVQVLRIIQEALTNIRKSAAARHVRVFAQVDGSILEITVEDDGHGFDIAVGMKKKGSFGLKIMQERAAEIKAQLYIHSWVGVGTKIILHVPLAVDRETED